MTAGTSGFAEWAVVELYGHRRIAGRVTEQEIGGKQFLRIDIPSGPTRFYGPDAVYGLHPCDEATATLVAASLGDTEPVSRWELRQPAGAITAAAAAADPAEYEPDYRSDDGDGSGPF